jgi:hypothetical protein
MTLPVVLVPGIMGSRLLLPGGVDWDPDNLLTMSEWATRSADSKRRDLGVGFRSAALPSSAFSSFPDLNITLTLSTNATLTQIAAAAGYPTATACYAARGWAGVSWRYYGKALVFLETSLNIATPFLTSVLNPVYAFAYDWRQPNRATALKLSNFIDQVLQKEGASQVAIVTHSMGGLVARAAYLSPSLAAKTSGAVHSAQPSNGAVVAYRRFLTGCRSPYDGTDVFAFFINIIMGNTREEYAALMSGIPAAVELLPNNQYSSFSGALWLVTSPPTDLTNIYTAYPAEKAPGIIPTGLSMRFGMQGPFIASELQARIGQAGAFHVALDNTGYPQTYVLYGDGLATDESADLTGPGLQVNQTVAGDTTVHKASGSCPGLAAVVQGSQAFSGVEHLQMFNDDTHNLQLLAFLRKLL